MKKIILVGKGGTGKDHFRAFLKKKKYKDNISFTSRPKRENENNGNSYYFISNNEFDLMRLNGLFQETNYFNNWQYGTLKESWRNCNLFIKEPKGVKKIMREEREQCIVIYFDIDKDVRFKRLNIRNDADNANRRLESDEEDFKDFKDFDIRITNPLFKPTELLKMIFNFENGICNTCQGRGYFLNNENKTESCNECNG